MTWETYSLLLLLVYISWFATYLRRRRREAYEAALAYYVECADAAEYDAEYGDEYDDEPQTTCPYCGSRNENAAHGRCPSCGAM